MTTTSGRRALYDRASRLNASATTRSTATTSASGGRRPTAASAARTSAARAAKLWLLKFPAVAARRLLREAVYG